MHNRRHPGFDRVEGFCSQPLWNRRAVVDARKEHPTVVENREHISATVFVKGRSWYAKKLLAHQTFPDGRAASRALIQSSRRLLDSSRQSIARTKNILAFARNPQKFVN